MLAGGWVGEGGFIMRGTGLPNNVRGLYMGASTIFSVLFSCPYRRDAVVLSPSEIISWSHTKDVPIIGGLLLGIYHWGPWLLETPTYLYIYAYKMCVYMYTYS